VRQSAIGHDISDGDVTEFNVSTLQASLDILVRQKLTKPFDVNAMVWKP